MSAEHQAIVERLLKLRQAAADDPDYNLKCSSCGAYHIFYEDTQPRINGHTYSRSGVAEVRVSNFCEYCFDLMFADEDFKSQVEGFNDKD